MNIFLIALIAVTMYKIHINRTPDVDAYLSHKHTTRINGFFILIVFYAHIRTYMPYVPETDAWMYTVATGLGQLMVALFLFYSGYGIHESIRRKPGYVHTLPRKRIGITWINFAFALLFFLTLDLILGREVTPYQVIFAFLGWTSIGNSAWYIFAILILYLLTYLTYTLTARITSTPVDTPATATTTPTAASATATTALPIALMFLVTIAFSLTMWWAKDGIATYSYNTVLCYPLGMAWSAYRTPIENALRRPRPWPTWLLLFAASTLAFAILRAYSGTHYLIFQLAALAYCLLALLITTIIHINSPILEWFGKNLFWIYVLQRLPMIAFTHIGLAENHRALFVTLTLLSTIALTLLAKKAIAPIQQLIR